MKLNYSIDGVKYRLQGNRQGLNVDGYDLENEKIAALLTGIYSRDLHVFMVIDALLKKGKSLARVLLVHKIYNFLLGLGMVRDLPVDAVTLACMSGGNQNQSVINCNYRWIGEIKLFDITARMLTLQKSQYIRASLALNPYVKKEILAKLAHDDMRLVRNLALRNENCPQEVLKEVLGKVDALHRFNIHEGITVYSNPNLPQEILAMEMEMQIEKVKKAASFLDHEDIDHEGKLERLVGNPALDEKYLWQVFPLCKGFTGLVILSRKYLSPDLRQAILDHGDVPYKRLLARMLMLSRQEEKTFLAYRNVQINQGLARNGNLSLSTLLTLILSREEEVVTAIWRPTLIFRLIKALFKPLSARQGPKGHK